jgi:hypothetical protein
VRFSLKVGQLVIHHNGDIGYIKELSSNISCYIHWFYPPWGRRENHEYVFWGKKMHVNIKFKSGKTFSPANVFLYAHFFGENNSERN